MEKDKKTYTKTVNYAYQDRKDGSSVYTSLKSKKTTNAGDKLAFTIPADVKPGSTVLVNVYYKYTPPGTIPVAIIAVNKSTGKEIQQLGSGTVSADSVYTNTTAVKSSLSSFAYTNAWDWSYQSPSADITTKTGNGTRISFKAPSANKITGGILVRIYYDGKVPQDSGSITLRVIMVTDGGSLIEEISKETITGNQSVSKTAEASRTVNGLTYTYRNKWNYDYDTSSGSSSAGGTGATAAFRIPSAAQTGTIVTLKFYYNTSIPEIVVPEKEAPIEVPMDTPAPYGVINGDKYTSPYFTSKEGIATTESQHVYVKTKDYLLGVLLENHTGKIAYYVPVRMHSP